MPPLPAEPSAGDFNLVARELLIPYAAYFLGVFIRRYGLPGDNTPLRCLLLLAIPLNLTIVTPILLASYSIIHAGAIYSYLVIIGIIMEQGMVVHEMMAKRLSEAAEATPPRPVAVTG